MQILHLMIAAAALAACCFATSALAVDEPVSKLLQQGFGQASDIARQQNKQTQLPQRQQMSGNPPAGGSGDAAIIASIPVKDAVQLGSQVLEGMKSGVEQGAGLAKNINLRRRRQAVSVEFDASVPEVSALDASDDASLSADQDTSEFKFGKFGRGFYGGRGYGYGYGYAPVVPVYERRVYSPRFAYYGGGYHGGCCY